MVGGSDGTNSRYMVVDSSGRPVVVGAGTAGSGAGGVLTVQGNASGTPIPVSGTVTAANASVGALGAAIPASGTQMGASDGTNLQSPLVFDADSGGGTQYVLGVNLRGSNSGGSVEIGTASNPVRTDPTGTTAQPITASSLPLPTNASQEHATAASPGSVRLSDGAAFYKATTPSDTQPVKEAKAATSALSNVAGSASNVTLLASNANRLRCVIINDNTSILYVKYGATASATSHTYRLLPNASITEDKWTGIIDGIWTVAGAGAARVTELTT
jgi:hypothetical protein